MSRCANKRCPAKHYKNVECAPNCGQFQAHKASRSEAAESARTKCSPAASSPDSSETTAVQLAHSLGSGDGSDHESSGESILCRDCGATLDDLEVRRTHEC